MQPTVGSPAPSIRWDRRRTALVGAVGVTTLALSVLIGAALASHPGAAHPTTAEVSSSNPTPVTTTPPTATLRTAQPSPAKPTPAKSTPAGPANAVQAIAAAQGLVSRQEAANQLSPDAAQQLRNHLNDLSTKLHSNNPGDATHSLQDLRQQLSDLRQHGKVSAADAAQLTRAFNQIGRFLPVGN
ncbi:FIMAH domain-containing protein [Actinacidiphila soli]|uniref:FIMAH domain-containing protein n=1 Tax=Actinacidiphila soli TaxID=2487275 RepID=UPI000FCC97CE|nr:hypothetical protein [Actinacidiphila soli]